MGNTYDTIFQKCKSQGITVGKMCSETGISQGVLSDLKKGRTKNLSANNLQKISEYLKCTVNELLGENISGPTTVSDDEAALDEELISRLCELTAEELEKVDAYVRGLLDAR